LRFKTVIKIYTEVVKCYEILHAGCNLRIWFANDEGNINLSQDLFKKERKPFIRVLKQSTPNNWAKL
jgi:hypothetical protein